MKQRVLFILHLPPPIHGAALVGQYIKESYLINQTFETNYINLSTSTNLQEIGKKGISKILTLLKLKIGVVRALLSFKPDICYLTLNTKGPGFYKDLLIVFILKIFNQRIIYHFHNKGVAENQNSKLNNYLYSFAFKNTKSILLSPFLYSDISKYVKAEDVSFIPNGIPEVCPFSDNFPHKYQAICQLLFLSNMMIDKGVFTLLQACKILKEKNLNFQCNFVGSWSDISEDQFNEYVIENGLSDYVFAHGKKYGNEKIKYFQDSEIFVLPTYNEAFPLVILEAMQFGLPVIATKVGGIPDEVIDMKTGYLIPNRDAVVLANRMEILIRDPELRIKMGVAGRKRYEELFTLEKFEKNMVEILTAAINKNEY